MHKKDNKDKVWSEFSENKPSKYKLRSLTPLIFVLVGVGKGDIL
jgi:hypothetical protein